MCPKPAPQACFRRRHRSPQASTQAGTRAHVAFLPRASLRWACTRSPRRKRIFVASIAARRLQRQQGSARMSRPARLRRAHAPEARTASAFSSQTSQPAGFSTSRNPRTCRAPRASAGHMRPKPVPQAHFHRKYCSPQASAQAGIRVYVGATHAHRRTLTPRVSVAHAP